MTRMAAGRGDGCRAVGYDSGVTEHYARRYGFPTALAMQPNARVQLWLDLAVNAAVAASGFSHSRPLICEGSAAVLRLMRLGCWE